MERICEERKSRRGMTIRERVRVRRLSRMLVVSQREVIMMVKR